MRFAHSGAALRVSPVDASRRVLHDGATLMRPAEPGATRHSSGVKDGRASDSAWLILAPACPSP